MTRIVRLAFAIRYNVVMPHTTEYIGGPHDGRIEPVNLADEVPDYVSVGNAIYKHMAIHYCDGEPGTTITVYHHVKTVPAGEVQETLRSLESG